MFRRSYVHNGLIGAVATLFGGVMLVRAPEKPGPAMRVVSSVVAGGAATASATAPDAASTGASSKVASALQAFSSIGKSLSSPVALEDGVASYYAYKSAHPADVKKPYLYFVDYGQPSTAKRGYVLDMDALTIVDGPFTVAHGRGSSTSQYGVPTVFSNKSGSAATSLGLYLTKSLYSFLGHTGGRAYNSVGLRLDGVSRGFNDNAYARKVVAHGAPYVTPTKAGRSEGCPAMEPDRAARLLPKLADGAMVFLYAPNQSWLAGDPWLAASNIN
jgi:hypothetical protein